MRRTDRLHALLGRLRDGRLHRAADLARALGVSRRTLYRDMDTLAASGLPVEGTRGAGYRLTAPLSLPPLSLTAVELEALHLGLAVVAEAADPELRDAARSLADRLDAALPEDRPAPPETHALATYPFAEAGSGFRHLPALRAAIRARQKLRLAYPEETGGSSDRTIRPLELDYRGRVWTLLAWCEADRAFHGFRVDRVGSVEILPELFVDEPGRTLDDYHARHRDR